MSENQENSVAKNVIIYGIGGALSQAAGLITLPLMTRFLSSFEYGVIEVITSLTGYFNLLIGLNMMTGLYRFFFETDEESGERKRMVSTTFIFVFFCGALVVLSAILFGKQFSLRLFGDVSQAKMILLAFTALVPVAVYTYALCLLRFENKPVAYIIITLIVSALYMASIVLFVMKLRIGMAGYYYARIIANTAGAAIALYLSRNLFTPHFSMSWFRELAKYSFPLVPGSLFAWSLSANNSMFLNASTDPVQVAYYGFANKATVVITLATQAFYNAWEPTMYSLLNRVEKLKRTLPVMLDLYIFGTLSVSTLMMTIAREAFLIMAPPEYLAGIGLLGIMQLRWIFTNGVYVIDPGTAKSGKTWWVSIILGLAVLVNLGANMILTPKFGIYGAVISELIGYGVAMAGRWIVSDRLFPIRWNLRYFVSTILIYGLAAFAQTRVIMSDMNRGLSFLLRLLLAGVVIGFGMLTLNKESKETLFPMVGSGFEKIKGFLSRGKKAA